MTKHEAATLNTKEGWSIACASEESGDPIKMCPFYCDECNGGKYIDRSECQDFCINWLENHPLSTGNSMSTAEKITATYTSHMQMLLEKNKRYGDSATEPKRIFSKQDAADSILVRLDDKISRIANSDEIRKNDVSDLIGYLMLYCVTQDWTDFTDQID